MNSTSPRIAATLIPGDGIGPEITEATLEALDALVHRLPGEIAATEAKLHDAGLYARDPAGFDDKVAAGCAASERFEATGDLLTIPAPGTFDDRRSRRRGGSAGGDVQAAVAVADLDRLGITDGKRLVAQPHRDRV